MRAGSSLRAFNSSAAMLCAVRNASPSSRTSVSASSVSVVPPWAARAASRATSKSASRIVAADQRDGPRGVTKHRRDQRLQVIFGIDDVAERRVVDGGDDRLRLADRLAGDRPRVLERHRISLLRHDAARLHEPLAEPEVTELHRAPQQKVLHARGPARPGESTSPTRSRADSRPSRCCRRCCPSARRNPAARWCAVDRSGNPVPVIAHAPNGL